VNADSPGWESPARAGDVAAARADGSPKRAVPLIPDPSGRPGLQSPHLLVIDREQGIDGCHTVTLRAPELIFSRAGRGDQRHGSARAP
jgi:hypothetical protein